jgi:NAD(P)H dehydrogenase (quinone)
MHSKPPGVATIAGACEVDRVIAKLVLAFGRQETTLFSLITNLLHFGMIIVGPPSFQGLMRLDEITGSSPYGAGTIAGGDGSRQPSENELAAVRY